MSNMRYTNGTYEVKYTRYPNRRHFRVQLVSDPKYHSHMRTFKEAIDLANFAKHHEIPEKANFDYLESLFRLAKDKKFRRKIRSIIDRLTINKLRKISSKSQESI